MTSTPPIPYILVTLVLYLLQGVVLGLSISIPIYLTSAGANWKHQGTYNFVHYPFSFKLAWAPIIDAFYIRRLGRRQTWLLPIQILIGISLIVLSFYSDDFISNLKIVPLTISVFFIIFFTATQDICVDGWTLSLFESTNVVWQSTSQTVGQTFGRFLGSSFLFTFESANFTNRYIRRPLSLSPKSIGLFTLPQFILFWGIAFIVVTIVVAILFRERQSESIQEEKPLNFFQTYLAIFKLFRKKCILKLVTILIISPFGYAATYFLTNITLISNGMSRETYGLITMPLIFIKILAPFILSKTNQPLIWFARLYPLRLILSVMIGVYVYFTAKLIAYPMVFYSVLVFIFAIHEAIIYLQLFARVGFYAQVSEPRIGGTYMTLVSTIGNIGQSISSSAVMYAANWFPKQNAYSIEVIICTVIGIIWLASSWRMMHSLQNLPSEKWYLNPKRSERIQLNESTTSIETESPNQIPTVSATT